MKRTLAASVVLGLLMSAAAAAQKDRDDEPTADLSFLVVKADNGKPIRNAAVIMHPVNAHGKQERGGLELKTDSEGRTTFDGIPYGKLRVQVLASGFQTYGEDFDVNKAKMNFTIKLKRPQGQYSIYDEHSKDANQPSKDGAAQEKKSDKPN
jgi:opacity protein-like surface antigen